MAILPLFALPHVTHDARGPRFARDDIVRLAGLSGDIGFAFGPSDDGAPGAKRWNGLCVRGLNLVGPAYCSRRVDLLG